MVTLKNPKILAVDDVPDNLYLLEAILSDEKDYQVSCVESGKSAIAAIETSPPDLILLDIMMPDITGYEITRRVRENQNLPYIPILLITAQDADKAAQGLEAGADGIIQKPFDIHHLLERVEDSLARDCDCGCGCEANAE
ncbi:MAG: response regulator [Cyanobacteria bacterium P01_A01_bin.116]|mgnify:CR=1 FL=1